MKQCFMEEFLPVCALLPDADRYTANPATDVYNLKYYQEITFILFEGAGGAGTTTLTVEECTAADGTGATAIAFKYRLLANAGSADTWGAWTAATSSGYLTIAGANKGVAIRVTADMLSAGYPYVRVQTTEDDSTAVDAVIIAILGGARYPQNVNLSAVV